jgi:hypothetical protein
LMNDESYGVTVKMLDLSGTPRRSVLVIED